MLIYLPLKFGLIVAVVNRARGTDLMSSNLVNPFQVRTNSGETLLG